MTVVGVIDVMNGLAVHARRGNRQHYSPVQRIGPSEIAGDALVLARQYRERFGLTDIYMADLDAIAGRAPQDEVTRALAATGASLWVDAAISTVPRAGSAFALGAARAVVGLETLRSFEALAAICAATASQRVVFSLDMRNGRAVAGSKSLEGPPAGLAARAAEAGAGAIVVLDLARVGSGGGVDEDVLAGVRAAAPGVMLLAGGGIRDAGDIRRLAALGCDGVLVATSLIEGRIAPAEIADLLLRT
jgi:phosphoribosylformimino-5-aminoimidazole carboxamide ribotide isomerase